MRLFTPSLGQGLLYALLVSTLYALYLYLAHHSQLTQLRTILATTIIIAIPLLWTYPINATDVYGYLIRGRTTQIYSLNPYTTEPQDLVNDPFELFAGEWVNTTTPYGPVWEFIAAGVSYLSGNSLYRNLLLFKGAGLTAHLLITLLIWYSLAALPLDQRRQRTLLWAWNPVLLFILVVDAHNDGVMLCWLLLGAYLIQRQRPTAGLICLALAPLTKMIGVLALPFFYATVWRSQQGVTRWRTLVVSLLGSLLLTAFFFAPFGSPLPLIKRLLFEANSNLGFSPVTLIYLFLRSNGIETKQTLATVAPLVWAVVVGWLGWQTWRHGRSPQRASADVAAAYLGQAFAFRIWYPSWILPWLLVDTTPDHHQARLSAGLTFLLTAHLSVVIYGHLWLYALGRNALLTHLIGVSFTFGLPFLVAGWLSRRQTA